MTLKVKNSSHVKIIKMYHILVMGAHFCNEYCFKTSHITLPSFTCFRKHFKQNFEGKKIHFLVLPSDLEVKKIRSKVKHIQNWARDLKQLLNDSSLYPEHIAFYLNKLFLLDPKLLAFKDCLPVSFWAIFRIFVTQFLKTVSLIAKKIRIFLMAFDYYL